MSLRIFLTDVSGYLINPMAADLRRHRDALLQKSFQ
ncbi:hypothetical protein Pvag_pPag30046 (plasmid) [Pantoea vagans C9-1]|nr:hypothetical protein Pvag_pPag30046 [Pantoea vagans C9-1]